MEYLSSMSPLVWVTLGGLLVLAFSVEAYERRNSRRLRKTIEQLDKIRAAEQVAGSQEALPKASSPEEIARVELRDLEELLEQIEHRYFEALQHDSAGLDHTQKAELQKIDPVLLRSITKTIIRSAGKAHEQTQRRLEQLVEARLGA